MKNKLNIVYLNKLIFILLILKSNLTLAYDFCVFFAIFLNDFIRSKVVKLNKLH